MRIALIKTVLVTIRAPAQIVAASVPAKTKWSEARGHAAYAALWLLLKRVVLFFPSFVLKLYTSKGVNVSQNATVPKATGTGSHELASGISSSSGVNSTTGSIRRKAMCAIRRAKAMFAVARCIHVSLGGGNCIRRVRKISPNVTAPVSSMYDVIPVERISIHVRGRSVIESFPFRLL